MPRGTYLSSLRADDQPEIVMVECWVGMSQIQIIIENDAVQNDPLNKKFSLFHLRVKR